jgi:hypothetical protein
VLYIVWEFRIRPARKSEFKQHYGPDGTWAQLFRKSAAYRETLLLADAEEPTRFVTIDIWNDLESFRRFKLENAGEYEQLDSMCGELTQSERNLGVFTS